MIKNQKTKMDRLEYLDKAILPIYGFKSINDYEKTISSQDITAEMIDKINGEMVNIKKYYKMELFKLSRKDYKLDNAKLAVNFLRKILQYSQIPYENIHGQNKNYVRLIRPDFLLMNYIVQRNMNQEVHELGKTYEKTFKPLNSNNCTNRYPIKVYNDGYIDMIEIVKKDDEELDRILIVVNGNVWGEYGGSFVEVINYMKTGNDEKNMVPIYDRLYINGSMDVYLEIRYKKPSKNEIKIKYTTCEIPDKPQLLLTYDYLWYKSEGNPIEYNILEGDNVYPVHTYIIKSDQEIDKIELYNDYLDSEDYHIVKDIKKILDKYYIININSANPFKEPEKVITEKFNKILIKWTGTGSSEIKICRIRINKYMCGNLIHTE